MITHMFQGLFAKCIKILPPNSEVPIISCGLEIKRNSNFPCTVLNSEFNRTWVIYGLLSNNKDKNYLCALPALT